MDKAITPVRLRMTHKLLDIIPLLSTGLLLFAVIFLVKSNFDLQIDYIKTRTRSLQGNIESTEENILRLEETTKTLGTTLKAMDEDIDAKLRGERPILGDGISIHK